ncbi:MAG: hypothetical protein ACI3XA_08185 [Clostridia bacterium]
MKLKRFLAIVISLAMVLSIVPAFSLTASAADITDAALLAYATSSTTALFDATNPAPTAVSDTAIATAWPESGWSGTINNGYLNVNAGPRIQCYIGSYTNGGQAANFVNLGSGYGSGNDWVLLRFTAEYTCAWGDLALYDIDGNILTAVRYGTGDSNCFAPSWGHSGWGTPYSFSNYTLSAEGVVANLTSGSSLIDILLRNYDPDGTASSGDEYYTATFFVNGTSVCVGTYTGLGNFNGLGKIGMSRGSGNSWERISMKTPLVYAGDYPATSDASTIAAALSALSVPALTKGVDITLPATATDSMGTTVDVTWTSSNTSVISNTGVVTAPAALTEVTLTPSATFEEATVTGSAKKVTVFPASYAKDSMYGYYKIGDKVDTSSISWYHRQTTDGSVGVDGLTTTTENGVTYYTFPALGGVGGTNARTSIGITAGNSYLVRFYYGGTALGNGAGNTYNKVYTTAGAYNDEVALDYVSGTASTGITTTANVWTEIQTVFTASEGANFLTFVYSWLDAGLKIADVELYNVTDLSKTVTLNILDVDGNTVKTLEERCISGGSVTFEAQSFASNGIFYTTEEKTYENVTEDATYTIFATADASKYASVESYTWNYTTGADISSTLTKGNISGLSDTLMTINWGNTRQGIINFNVPITSGQQLASATLTLRLGGQQGDSVGFDVYAMPKSKSPKVAAAPDSAAGVKVGSYSGSYSGEAQDAVIEVPLTFSDYVDTSEGLTLRLAANSQMGVYWGANQGERAPFLSNITMGEITATAVTVNCVDTNSTLLQTGTQYHTSFYGYNSELIYPELEIPTIDGYIFKSKSVSGTTVTLKYAQDTQDDYFFDNITNMNTRFISLNMLGAHNAFTSEMTDKSDAAALKQENSMGGAYGGALAPNTALPRSKAQDKDTLEMLRAGARYFDIRVSRSESNSSYLGVSAKHTNGVMYTTHALLGGELRPILYTIAQWAETHPGEIIVLDFQEFYDYNSGYDGNSTAQSWRDLDTLLTQTGVNNYVTIGNQSLKNVTYGDLTSNGTKAGIVLFGRATATNSSVGKFILRGTLNNAFEGKAYSNYDKSGTSIGSSYSAAYIQAQVDHMDQYQSVTGDSTGDNIIYWMFRIMQGQSEGSNLVTQGASDNTSLYNGIVANPSWLTALPVVMVNTVGTNTDNIVTLLKECNVPTETVNYVYNGTVVKSVPNAALVGTLYTNDGFYDEPVYKLMAGTDGEYYVSETFYTAPSAGTVTKVVKGSAVEVDVTKLGNVYSSRGGKLYADKLTDDGAYTGKDSFAAFNWGTTPADRIGVAVLSAETGRSAYMLSATEVRKYFNTSAGATKFYAIPAATYRSLDLYNASEVISYMTDANLVATISHGNCGDTSVGTAEIILDTDKISAIAASGDVVILGDSVNGLYGLKNDISIVSCYVVESTTEGATTTTVVKPGGTYTLGTAKVYEDGDNKLYAPESNVTVTGDMTFNGYNTLGANVVNGAQVRIGDGVDKDGKISTGSGLRFITTVNAVDTIAGLTNITEIGVRITAEGNSAYKDIVTTDWQTEDHSVFTSALTNLEVTNYNRKFTATPYVKYTDTATGDEVVVLGSTETTRSIYQVAAGLLANGYTTDNGTGSDPEDHTGEMPEVLVKVLNAYVNQTGIRLTLADSTLTARTTGSGSYTGDAFFEVSGATTGTDEEGNTTYTCVLTPVGSAKINTNYWNEYVRINNNNKAIAGYVELADNGNNTYTLTFKYGKYSVDKAAASAE